MQQIRVAAVEADSIAASSYLADSVEQAVLRGTYDERLGAATRALADVAQRAPAGDVEALATANATLTTFAGLVEQARANNLQGFPVGAAYQRQASALITDDLLPALDAVDLASRQRLNDALSDSTRNGVIAIVLLLVALVALVVASWVLFRRTRRLVNVPIAVGVLLGARRSAVVGVHAPANGTDDRRHRRHLPARVRTRCPGREPAPSTLAAPSP